MNLLSEDSDDEDSKEIRFEGYLYKVTQLKKIKKLWFKLVGKDLYYFKTKESVSHQGMHCLAGVYFQEEQILVIEGRQFYSFSVIYPNKIRKYFCESEKEFRDWIKFLKMITGYSMITDLYEVKVSN